MIRLHVFDCDWHYHKGDVREYQLDFNQTVLRVFHLGDHLIVEKINLSQVVYPVSVDDLRIPL